MKKFSKGLFAFLAIAFVMGLSAMVVSAKEVSLSPENFPDAELRKQLDDEEYRIRETKMVWYEDEEEWYEEDVYEEGEKYYDEDDEEWYTKRIPVYKKDAAGNYIINTENVWGISNKGVKDFSGVELLEDAKGFYLVEDSDLDTLPSEFADRITTLTAYANGDISRFKNVTKLWIYDDFDPSQVPSDVIKASKIKEVWGSENITLEKLDLSSWDCIKEVDLMSHDFSYNNTLKSIKLGKNVENLYVSGFKKLSKVEIPKNSKLKTMSLWYLNGNVKSLDLKNCKNLKSLSINTGVKQIKNIPDKLKNISINGQEKVKLNVTKFLGKGYKKTGKAKGAKYDKKKGILELSGGSSYISLAKGSKKIKLYIGESNY